MAYRLYLFALLTMLFASEGFSGEKLKLTVTTVSGEDQVREGVYTQTTPGISTTNCGGTAATVNCQTTSTPARTTDIPIRRMDVRNVVDGNGMRYTILCSAKWVGSNCFPMVNSGELWEAEIDGTTMWINARKGGNLGKKVRVKFQIIDLRPLPSQ